MRNYGTIVPQFWTGTTGKALRGHPDAQDLANFSAPSAALKMNPCIMSQPILRNGSICSAQSTPSATTRKFRLCAIATTADATPKADGSV